MKNWIYSILNKKLIFSILFACSTFLAPMRLYAPRLNEAPAAPVVSSGPSMTPEQEAAFLQEMEKINEEMQAFVKTLPPEEQEKIAQLEEKINNMSDKELDELFNTMINDPEFLEALEEQFAQTPPVHEEPVVEQEESVQTPGEKPIEKPKVEKNKIAQAAEMIKSLSEITDSFLSKIENVHEIDDLVRNWIKKDRLHDWKSNVNWDIIKAQLELFNQKLKKMLFKEPGSNEYRFLPDLIKEESVYNNLAHTESILKVTVPQIAVSVVGFEKSSKEESKKTVLTALNKYSEAMSTLQLIPALNAIIDKHEPIAKQLREKEDALSKKALEESKKPRAEKPMVTAGKSETRSGSGRDYQDSSYYPNYNSSYQPHYSPSYGAQPEAARGGEKSAGGGAGTGSGKGTGGESAKPSDKDKDKDKSTDKDKDKGHDKNGKKDDKKSKGKENPLAKGMADVEKKLKEANEESGNDFLIRMAIHLGSPTPAPADLAQEVKKAASKINTATASIKKLGKELAEKPEKTKKEYQGKVRTAFNRQNNLVAISSQIQSLQNHPININIIRADKKAAYGFEMRAKKQDHDKKQDDVEDHMDAQQAEPVDEIATPTPILDEAARAAQQAGRPADEQQLFNTAEPRPGATPQTTTKAPKKSTKAQPAPEGQPSPEKAVEAPRYTSSLEEALTGLHQAIADLTK